MEQCADSARMSPWNAPWSTWLADIDSFIVAAPPAMALRT
jgi:hypothetical protein